MPTKSPYRKWNLPKKHKHYNLGYVYERKYKDTDEFGVAWTLILDGKQIRRTTKVPFTPNNRDYVMKILVKRIDLFLSEKEQIINGNRKDLYITDLIVEYKKTVFANSTEQVKHRFEIMLKQLITNNFILNNTDDIRNMILDNLEKTGNSNTTRRKKLNKLFAMFQLGVDLDYMEKNPILKTMVPKMDKPDRKSISAEKLDLIIQKIKENGDIEFWLLIRFLRLTGMRRSEALRVEWNDIDNDFILIHGKNKTIRYFPITPFPALKEVLSELKEISTGKKLFSFATPDAIGSMWRKRLRRWNLYVSGESFHAIRKRCENDLREIYNFDYDDIAAIIGHTRQIQEKHYLEEFKYDKIKERMLKKIETTK